MHGGEKPCSHSPTASGPDFANMGAQKGGPPMRASTLLTLVALGAAGYYVYTIAEQQNKRRLIASNWRAAPIVMWFETADERNAFCEGAD